MDEIKQKIALFIDADNAPASKFEKVLSEVAKYGLVTIRKAYGNWKSPTFYCPFSGTGTQTPRKPH
jgi:uncharacterized LabA/DUF88 family protein